MDMRRYWMFALVPLALAVVAGAAVTGAQGLPKLPGGLAVAKSADSPGQVTFNHFTHVDDAKPDCTTCHPKPFSILGSKGGTRAVMKHELFEKGEQCGSCHNGKKAFALEDDCTNCHREGE
jgi:c(7)-type cytochrome triheme protein